MGTAHVAGTAHNTPAHPVHPQPGLRHEATVETPYSTLQSASLYGHQNSFATGQQAAPAPGQDLGHHSTTRARHVTTGQLQGQQLGWQGTTAPAPHHLVQRPAPLAGQQHLNYLAAQRQPAHPWDHPVSLNDMESDPHLTRRVAEALQAAAAPLAGTTGKHALFPHHLITRGPKKQKTTLGDLTLAEYAWGFTQLIKLKKNADDSVPYMNAHLEKIFEDAIVYPWEVVRAWSEEVCSRVALSKLRWCDMYAIDRLQTTMAQLHTSTISSHKPGSSDKGEIYSMSDEVRRGKPGPPCKFFQNGSCSHVSDHVQNGYRQLHVCTYCLSGKCLFQPHSLKDCKTKKFNVQKKNQQDSGFGN